MKPLRLPSGFNLYPITDDMPVDRSSLARLGVLAVISFCIGWWIASLIFP